MNKLKKELIDHLMLNGRPNSWKKTYDKFPYRGNLISNKKKSDSVRSLWNRLLENTPNIDNYADKKNNKSGVKILIFDTENLPLISAHFSLWKQNINHKTQLIRKEHTMITWAAKWLGSDVVMSSALTPKEILKEDDSRIVKQLWNLLDQADIIIAHNSAFDTKVANARFLKHGLNLPSTYKEICTYKASKKTLKLPSHSLDYIAKFLGLGGKLEHTGMNLWMDCLKGNQEAIDLMLLYNTKDVTLLEDVYIKLRPFIKGHPNISLFQEEPGCTVCGSDNIIENSIFFTKASKYMEYRCKDCGTLSKNKKAIKHYIDNRPI